MYLTTVGQALIYIHCLLKKQGKKFFIYTTSYEEIQHHETGFNPEPQKVYQTLPTKKFGEVTHKHLKLKWSTSSYIQLGNYRQQEHSDSQSIVFLYIMVKCFNKK